MATIADAFVASKEELSAPEIDPCATREKERIMRKLLFLVVLVTTFCAGPVAAVIVHHCDYDPIHVHAGSA
jgi:hypothetical protein